MPELAEIFRLHSPHYLDRFKDRMLPSHLRAVRDIADCRTEALGGHIFECNECGERHFAYHSCRNRHCPKCQGKDTQAWIDKCRESLLPVQYFHLVFTLPQELRELVRGNQRVLLGVLCQAAAQSLMKLAADPHYIGGKIGILAVVHTWTRAMIYHPHVHCLVPGGGLSQDGSRWIPARRGFLVPVTALSLIFRAKFMEMARAALPEVKFPESVWSKSWVVYSKPGVQGKEKVLNYLARYVHRVAITNRRILSIEDGQVRFRCKDSRENAWKTMTLCAEEFIRRFLQHVLPQGFHKVRHYGLLAQSNQHLLQRAKEILPEPAPPAPSQPKSPPAPMRCPSCKTGQLCCIGRIPRKGRSPP